MWLFSYEVALAQAGLATLEARRADAYFKFIEGIQSWSPIVRYSAMRLRLPKLGWLRWRLVGPMHTLSSLRVSSHGALLCGNSAMRLRLPKLGWLRWRLVGPMHTLSSLRVSSHGALLCGYSAIRLHLPKQG